MQDQTGRRATAEKIGTENGLAPCALLLMFGRTVGLSLSIRSIPPAEQEMNLSANMIKAEGLWRTVGREYEGKGRPNRKAGKEKNGPPMNGKGVPRGRSHLGLREFRKKFFVGEQSRDVGIGEGQGQERTKDVGSLSLRRGWGFLSECPGFCKTFREMP